VPQPPQARRPGCGGDGALQLQDQTDRSEEDPDAPGGWCHHVGQQAAHGRHRKDRPHVRRSVGPAPSRPDVERLLTDAQLYWIITVRADRRPHAAPLDGVWHDGTFAFCTGPQEQKKRNLDASPQVSVTTGSTGADGWDSGVEIVVEGTARWVSDTASLQSLASAWSDKYGDDWRFEVSHHEFVELSHSGGSTWVYRVDPAKVIAFGGAHGQTTYRF